MDSREKLGRDMIKMGFSRALVLQHHDEMLNETKPNALAAMLGDTLRFMAMEEAPNSHLPLVPLVRSNMIDLAEIVEKYIHIHVGKFLLCRTIAPSFLRKHELNLAVDDPDGKFACSLLVSNKSYTLYTSNGIPQKNTLTSLPVGTILALMNPWLTMNTANIMGLCCQNPSAHLVILGKHHPLLRDGSITFKADLPFPSQVVSYDHLEPKEAGVKYFGEKNYVMAVECFSQALEKCENDVEMRAKQYGNRAQTLLLLGKPELAIADAEKGLELEPKNVKLMFRFAKSLFLLKRYNECVQFLKKSGPEVVSVPELNALLTDSVAACQEAKLGKYDLLKMHEESKKSLYLEGHADYFDSRLEIREVPGFGRGIVIKEDIAPGALLIAEKAFAFLPVEFAKGPFGGEPRFPDCMHGNDDLMSLICAKMSLASPSTRKKYMDLFDTNDGSPVLASMNNDGSPVYADFGQIRRIARANGFLSSDTMSSRFIGNGLWITPTYINHACVDVNCNRNYIGNCMFVFAIRKIKRGEQLLFSYCLNLDPFKERQKHCKERGFECQCRLCQLERADPPSVKKKIEAIFEKFQKYPHFSSIHPRNMCQAVQQRSIAELRSLLDEARALRPNRSLNLLATQIACALASTLQEEGKKVPMESIRLLEDAAKVYEDLGLFAPLADCAFPLGRLHPNPARRAFWVRKVYETTRLQQGDERLLDVLMDEVTSGQWKDH